MPGSPVIRVAVFTAGALLGGGIATVVSTRKNQEPALPSQPEPAPLTKSLVLKYGHPGEFGIALLPENIWSYLVV